ncbi:hypothetical protein MMC25_007006 [Agyrium rufum]|nr:hypothetical protein [Agyrium rufum]
MTDSPALRTPVDTHEQPILESVLYIRDQLSLLKQDKSTYIKSHDVIALYDQTIKQVQTLNEIRQDHGKPLEQNRVDFVLDDCFQLISLFFLTIGRNNEAPAVYSMTSTVKRLLDHLQEAQLYTAKDLISITETVKQMRQNLDNGKEKHSPHLLKLLENRLETCLKLLQQLHTQVDQLHPDLVTTQEKMISILRSMAAANTRSKFPRSEVEGLKAQLKEMEATMVDGAFVGLDGKPIPDQALVVNLLQRLLFWSDLVLERQGKIDERFQKTYEDLVGIRNALEKLSLTQAWSLRETDLYSYQRHLDRIDESRIEGNFQDERGNKADLYAQRTMLYLIRRSYAYIYGLIIASEPVSEALLPIYNQLQTLRRCLMEVKKSGGVNSPRELYPYSMKLTSIDNMRVDGKFLVGSDIPEGQGSVNALLAECFDLNYELRVAADEGSADGDDGD